MSSKFLSQQKPNLLHRQQLGKTGEEFSTSYLISKGYRIVSRNFRALHGELDIVALTPNSAKDPKTVIVEVKTRIGREFGLPEEAVTPRKLKEVIRTSEYFMLQHPEYPQGVRIDVIALEYNEDGKLLHMNHIENASV